MADTRTPISPDYGTPKHEGGRVEEPTPNARQGVTGHNVRYVLAVSTTAVVAVFAIVYLLFFAG